MTNYHYLRKSCALLALLIAIFIIAACGNEQAQKKAEIESIPEIRPGILKGYLEQDELPNSLKLVPPPPAKNTADFALDQEIPERFKFFPPRCVSQVF